MHKLYTCRDYHSVHTHAHTPTVEWVWSSGVSEEWKGGVGEEPGVSLLAEHWAV